MEKQPDTLFQPEKRRASSKKCLVICLSVFFTAIAVAGIAVGTYSVVNYNNSMRVKHLRYREVDEDGNADVADTYVSPRQRRITQELEVEHRPGLHANSSTVLSDFKSGFRAYRTKGQWSQCLVMRIQETFEEAVEEVESQKPTGKRQYVIVKEAIHRRVLRETVGAAIADHCQNVEAFWMIPARDEELKETEEEEVQEDEEDGFSTTAPGAREKRAICRYCRFIYLGNRRWFYRCIYFRCRGR